MSKEMLIGVVILLFIAGFGAIAYGLFGTISVLPRLTNTTMGMDDIAESSQPGFSIERVRYHSTTVIDASNMTRDICDSIVDKQIVIVDVLYDAARPPEDCEILVDGSYSESLDLIATICRDNCSGQEMKLSVDIAEQDVYRSHTVQVCCSQSCAKKSLSKLCE